MATSTSVIGAKSKPVSGRLRGADEVAWAVTFLFALLILGVTVWLVYELWSASAPSREKFGFGFLTSRLWNPVTDEFGALPYIYGTVLTSFLALLISVPLGVGAAVYLSELAPPKLSNALTFLVELLAAVPSVIFGLIAIFTLIPLMRTVIGPALKSAFGWTPFFTGPVFGVGYLTAGLILAIMTFPFIISVSREALMSVPREQREAALALGATKWESTYQIVVPFARLGIFGSIFLGLARALGETMAVTMVIGNSPTIKASLLSSGHTIAAVLASEFTEATGKIYTSALVELGLVLFVLTMLINGLAQLLILITTKRGSAKA
jgi:phosphate transport system permease protein